jgi:hypothetical protein
MDCRQAHVDKLHTQKLLLIRQPNNRQPQRIVVADGVKHLAPGCE